MGTALPHWMQTRTRSQTPLVARRLLVKYGIPQAELARCMLLNNGRQPSPSTINQIMIRDLWPRTTPKKVLQDQIIDFLTGIGVTQAELDVAFELDENPDEPIRLTGHAPARRNGQVPAPFEDTLPEADMLSHTAKQHFKLFKDPFIDDVQGPDDVFLSAEQRYIREALFTTAKHGGFLAVVGESGAGKTTLRRDLVDRIAREGQSIVLIQPRIIDKGRLTASGICDAIIRDISQQKPKQSLEAKSYQIETLLMGSSRAGQSHALVLEEAHDLSVQTLKYLKRFWELEDGFRKLLAIILIGQLELKNKLDERQNWEAREVIRRCEIAELKPLNGDLENYLALKFKRVGKSLADIFAPDAMDGIRQRLVLRRRGTDQVESFHYPLVVNNLIVKALNLAAEAGAPKVNAEIITEV